MEEVILDPGPLGLGDVAAIDQDDADLGQDAAQVAPDRLLVGGELRDGLVDEDELLGGRQAVGAALGDALAHLRLDAGDADHEELIKVIGGNRQESDPLQRRMARIDRFLQHPAIEMQPGQFAVDEAFRACCDRRAGFGFASFSFITTACAESMKIRSIRAQSGAVQAMRAQSMCYRDDVSMTLMFPRGCAVKPHGRQPGQASRNSSAASARVTGRPSRSASAVQQFDRLARGGKGPLDPRCEIAHHGLIDAELPVGAEFHDQRAKQLIVGRQQRHHRHGAQPRAQIAQFDLETPTAAPAP